MFKRALDILFAFVGIILLLPLMLLVSILIKIESKGPIFYRQTRVGKGGRPFSMFKFRTMMEVGHWTGLSLSRTNDPRVTNFGALLRRTKINEMPQLLNVLKGDMSIVGPRPEVPEFVLEYSEAEKNVLSVRPGIVGPSQIRMRNEEEMYPEGVDTKKYYVEHILPEKLKIDLEYVDDPSIWKDLKYLLQGVGVTISGVITKRHLFENAEQIALFCCDVMLCTISYFLAYYLRMEGVLRSIDLQIIGTTLPYIVVSRMLTMTYFGQYSSLLRYFSSYELGKVVVGVTFGSLLAMLLTFMLGERSHPRSVFAIDWFVLIFFLGGYRLLFKTLRIKLGPKNKKDSKKIIIYGADNMGDLALRYLKMEGDGEVIAFIDDDPRKMRKRFQGLRILGNRYDIEALAKLYHIDEILIAAQYIAFEDREHIQSLCAKAEVKCEVFALAN